MYSSDNTMGTLEVRIASLGGSSVGDLRITGNQGNIWHRAKFQVSNVLSISGYTNVGFSTTNQILKVFRKNTAFCWLFIDEFNIFTLVNIHGDWW